MLDMYRADQKIIHIDLERLRSHDGTWQINYHLTLALGDKSWESLDIADTLDYGALAGQLRFILDSAAEPKAALEAYGPLLSTLFPLLTITDYSLTITSTPLKSQPDATAKLWLGPFEDCQKKDLTAAVLICSGVGAGQWFLSPYGPTDLGRKVSPKDLCLTIPYEGYLETSHFKDDYYRYSPSEGESQ